MKYILSLAFFVLLLENSYCTPAEGNIIVVIISYHYAVLYTELIDGPEKIDNDDIDDVKEFAENSKIVIILRKLLILCACV